LRQLTWQELSAVLHLTPEAEATSAQQRMVHWHLCWHRQQLHLAAPPPYCRLPLHFGLRGILLWQR
jgi:hypothetical protein